MGMMCLVDLDGVFVDGVFVDGVFVEFPRARELWIPAFAGLTECFSRALGYFLGRWGIFLGVGVSSLALG